MAYNGLVEAGIDRNKAARAAVGQPALRERVVRNCAFVSPIPG